MVYARTFTWTAATKAINTVSNFAATAWRVFDINIFSNGDFTGMCVPRLGRYALFEALSARSHRKGAYRRLRTVAVNARGIFL